MHSRGSSPSFSGRQLVGSPAWVLVSSRKDMQLLLALLGVLLEVPGAPALSLETSEEMELGMAFKVREDGRGGHLEGATS